MQYQLCLLRLAGQAGYFVWTTDREGDAPDAVVVVDGQIPVFERASAAHAFARGRGLIQEETAPTLFDFDRLATWCRQPDVVAVDCEGLLNAWNLFGDIPRETDSNLFAHVDRGANHVYDKLFWGNNIPAVTPAGESYTPEWSSAELTLLRQVVELGLNDFANRVSHRAGV